MQSQGQTYVSTVSIILDIWLTFKEQLKVITAKMNKGPFWKLQKNFSKINFNDHIYQAFVRSHLALTKPYWELSEEDEKHG